MILVRIIIATLVIVFLYYYLPLAYLAYGHFFNSVITGNNVIINTIAMLNPIMWIINLTPFYVLYNILTNEQ